MNRFLQIAALFSAFFLSAASFGQQSNDISIEFIESPLQKYGFDKPTISEVESNYEKLEFDDQRSFLIPFKSVRAYGTDRVRFVVKNKKNSDLQNLKFRIGGNEIFLDSLNLASDTSELVLPKRKNDYAVEVFYLNQIIGKLNVNVYSAKRESVIVVPLTKSALNKDSLTQYLNSIYAQAGVKFDLSIQSIFNTKNIDSKILSNPSQAHDRYTDQMTAIRDLYFEKNPSANKKANYIFIINEFVDETLGGYMVRNKSVGFIKETDLAEMHYTIARELGYGIGSLNDTWKENGTEEGTTTNLMDHNFGTDLTEKQWELIRAGVNSYSFYDDYEDVQTNNGIIAFYFWKEDQEGNIIFTSTSLMGSINRPFKKNQYSVYLEIDNFFYYTVFTVFGQLISVLHVLGFVVFLFLSILLRRKLIAKWRTGLAKYRVIRFSFRIINFAGFIVVYVLLFLVINQGYSMFEVNDGLLKDLNGMSLENAKTEIRNNNVISKLQESSLGSEIVVKKGDNWYLKKRKCVLYFSITQDGEGGTNCQFINDSDTLIVDSLQYIEKAQSHYMVFNYYSDRGEALGQKVFNHIGNDITEKLKLNDPVKRILLFVNGYRPTSTSHTFEDNFKDIQKNGLEFPNSNNKVYSFDRYDYWGPWNQIDDLFKKRINPTESYYADGHFSVSTSNHRSLVDFTALSSIYPERCANKKKHVCKKTTVNSWRTLWFDSDKKTVDLFNLKPNKIGFNEREKNGKIAGRNLHQIFNELPNVSSNDTLYIVAHSMGYAYALGIIEQLRGKITFGGLYIIAPENASTGNIDMKEWKEVWQYGDNFSVEKDKSPCLLDGVAPQTKVGGLLTNHRVYIPTSNYSKKGFYSSHFIGYYTWIFQIDENAKGYIKQH